jgi:hypothetical protein
VGGRVPTVNRNMSKRREEEKKKKKDKVKEAQKIWGKMKIIRGMPSSGI